MTERIRRIHYGALAVLLLIATITTSITIPSSVSAYAGGNGAEDNPWQIANCTQLHQMGYEWTDGANTDFYVLANNINCTGIAFESIKFGEGGDSFRGHLNGAGHTISNITLDEDGNNRVGLFSAIDGAEITDLTISNSAISGNWQVGTLAGYAVNSEIENVHIVGGTVTGTQTEDGSLGGLVGISRMTNFTNVSASTAVSGYQTFSLGGLIGETFGGTISKAMASGNVSGYQNIGGLIGRSSHNTGTETVITESFATGNATADNEYAGGLIGYNDFAYVSDSYSRGDVSGGSQIGGLVGYNGYLFERTYATGLVTATGEDMGGLVASQGEAEMRYSFWDAQTSGTASSAGGTSATTAQMKDIDTFTTNLFDDSWDFNNVWIINEDTNDGYPCLRWSDESCSESTGDSSAISTITTGTTTSITQTGARIYGTAQLANGYTIADMTFNGGNLMLGFHFNTSQPVGWDNYTHTAPVMTVAPIDGDDTHLSFYADYNGLECGTQYWYIAAYDRNDADDIGIANNALSFTTAACNEDDNDGVANDVEAAAPNNGDGNNDGVPDAKQAHVASLVSPVSQKYITLAVDESCSLSGVSIADASSHATKDDAYLYQSGFVNFTATGCDEGVANVKLYYHGVSPDGMIARKYNPTTSKYFTISQASIATVPAPLSGTLVSYTITDNSELDIDSTNGVIVDPVGLASTAAGVPNTGLAKQNTILPALAGVTGLIILLGFVTPLRTKVQTFIGSKK